MKSVLCLSLMFVLAVAAVGETPERIDLFNGENLDTWKLFLPDADADPADTWSVSDGVIHCTGVPHGYMRTTEQYGNYILHLEWRFPGEPGNSGVLLHVHEPDQVWPKSIEAQLHSGNAGDFWVIGGTSFKEHTDPDNRRVVKREDASENPVGEWNRYRIVCDGDSIEVYVNDVLQNKATECTVTSGYIGLQSEGAPIEFRNIYIEPIAP